MSEATPQPDIIERLAELEHEQWQAWATAVWPDVTDARRARWAAIISAPYSALTDEMKEQDRVWARKVYAALAGRLEAQQAVVDAAGRSDLAERLDEWADVRTGDQVEPLFQVEHDQMLADLRADDECAGVNAGCRSVDELVITQARFATALARVEEVK